MDFRAFKKMGTASGERAAIAATSNATKPITDFYAHALLWTIKLARSERTAQTTKMPTAKALVAQWARYVSIRNLPDATPERQQILAEQLVKSFTTKQLKTIRDVYGAEQEAS
jgi:hypothetical protein